MDVSKVQDDVAEYLGDYNVQVRPYTDMWPFLRRREWGEGKVSFLKKVYFLAFDVEKKKVLIAPQTSYAISLMLHVRFTLAPSYIEHMMSIKNDAEIDGMRRAYLRDGVSFVRLFFSSLFPSFIHLIIIRRFYRSNS